MFSIYKRELKFIAKNKALAIITFIMPSLWALMLGCIFSEQQIKDQPAAVLNLDRTQFSRNTVETNLNSAPYFNILYHPESLKEAQNLMEADKIQILFIIPKDFERKVKSSQPVKIEAEVNNINLALGSVLSLRASEIIGMISGGVELQVRIRTQNRNSAMASVQPVSESFHFLNNPAFVSNYSMFLLFGMFLNCIMIAALYYPTRGLFRDFQNREYYKFPYPLMFLIEKTLAYLTIIYPGCILGLEVCVLFGHVPMHASVFQTWSLTFWFCTICIWLGMSIPVLFRSQEFGFTVAAVTFMPSFLVCGYTWPGFMLPEILQIFASFLPLKYYVFAMREIAYQQYLKYDITPYINGMMLWTCAALALAFAMTLIIIHNAGNNHAE